MSKAFRKVGVVMKKFLVDGHPVVEVQYQQMKMNRAFKVFLPTTRHKYCIYGKKECNIGDMVVITNLDKRLTHKIYSEVDDYYFKLGEIHCPITGRRCRGTSYIDS